MPIDSEIPKPKRVAIIHDWLLGYRGGEHILKALCELYPQAEIFTLFHRPGSVHPAIEKHKIHASFLNYLPFNHRYYRYLLPLFPLAIEKFNLAKFDLVLSSSHCVAKGVLPAPNSLHLCYSHTPMRYAWDRSADYFGGGSLEPLIAPFLHYLRIWDTSSSARVDHFIANSEWVRARIKKYYRRDAQVIHPFVETEMFKPAVSDTRDYYLVVSAFAPYKRLDLAIEACEKLGRSLKIVGGGQDEGKLKKLAGKHTQFLGRLTHNELCEVYAGAKALLFPGEEDFGITPLEAMASGVPVIAFGRGGAQDTIIENVTGLFFDEQTTECLVQKILAFEKDYEGFNQKECSAQAAKFSRSSFLLSFQKFCEKAWNLHRTTTQLDSSLQNPTSKSQEVF